MNSRTERRICGLRENHAVLAASSLLGLLFGLFVYPNWQVLLIPVKIIAGAVAYPQASLPQYINMKSWNLLSQVFAQLMRQGWTDAQISLAASAIQGMAGVCGISLIALAVTGRPLMALCAGPVFLYFGLWSGGIIYPIHLIGFHSYGIVGLDFALLTLGLFVTGMFAPAAFFAGLLLCLHPSWGVWVDTTLGLYFILHFRRLENKVAILGCLAAGLAISAGSYAYQLRFIPALSAFPPVADAFGLTDRQYFMACLHSWPGHRLVGLPIYLHKQFAVSVCGCIASALLLARPQLGASVALKRFAWFHALFFGVTLAASLCITLLPDLAPEALHILMPNRSWCLTFLLTVLMALTIGFAELKSRHLRAFLLLAVGLLVLQAHSKAHLMLVLGPLMVAVLALRREDAPALAPKFALAAAAILCGGAVWAVGHIPLKMIQGQPLRYDGGEVTPMTPALEVLDRAGGTVALAPSVNYYMQYRIKSPVVFSMEIAAAPYAPELMPLIDRMAEDFNGEGFVRPYLERRPALKDVFPNWQARTREEWGAVMARYGVDNIVVRAQDHLDLPLLAEDATYRVYRRP